MKMGVFVSDYMLTSDLLERIGYENVGIILVANGVYHATQKEGGKDSPILGKCKKLYVLSEDLDARGLAAASVDKRAKVVTYSDVVDVIFNDFEKIAWL